MILILFHFICNPDDDRLALHLYWCNSNRKTTDPHYLHFPHCVRATQTRTQTVRPVGSPIPFSSERAIPSALAAAALELKSHQEDGKQTATNTACAKYRGVSIGSRQVCTGDSNSETKMKGFMRNVFSLEVEWQVVYTTCRIEAN